MTTRTKRAAASPRAKRSGRAALGFFAGRVLLEEAPGVEGFSGGAPSGGIGMDDGGGHLHDGACFEEVCIVERRVFEHDA